MKKHTSGGGRRSRRHIESKQLLMAFLLLVAVLLTAFGAANWELPEPPDTSDTSASSGSQSSANGVWVTVNGEDVPEYTEEPYYELNGNVPVFGADEFTDRSYEFYSELDADGRCRYAIASIGKDLMPTEDRESISHVHPTGWHSVTYPFIENGGSLYNRCHMIAFQLTGENANEKNLITGTRYFNVDGMFPFEDLVADYVRETGNHVVYRVTPIFVGDERVCRGVVMSAMSVHDKGDDIMFNVFVYNVQPGVIINYETGKSTYDPDYDPRTGKKHINGDYIINTEASEFHLPDCALVPSLPASGKRTFTGDRYQLILDDYSPCRSCRP